MFLTKEKKSVIAVLMLIAPLVSLADTDIESILRQIQGLLEFIIPTLIVIATIIFISGLIWYISSSNKEDKQKEARSLMIWGIIILFAIVAVWGLVKVLSDTFNIDKTGIPTGPHL